MGYLAPLPANLILVLLDPDICVNTFTANQLKVGVAAIRLHVLGLVKDCKILTRVPAMRNVHQGVKESNGNLDLEPALNYPAPAQ